MVTTPEYYQKNKKRILAKNAEWMEKNRERHRETSRKWYERTKKDNVEKYLLKYAKARANKKKIPFNLSIEDIIIPNKCPIFNVPFIVGDSKYSLSIDRIVPEKGYVKDNIQIISSLANKMKWNASQEELESFCRGYLKFLEGGFRDDS